MINVDASIKIIIDVKKIIFGILQHLVAEMENINKFYWELNGNV